MNPLTRRNWFAVASVATLSGLYGCAGRPLWIASRSSAGTGTAESPFEKPDFTNSNSDSTTIPERPSRFTMAADPLIVHSNREISPNSPMIREVRSLRFGLTELGLPIPEEPVHIYLFDNESEFLAYAASKISGFADRHAFFAQSSQRLEVYTFLSDELPSDLRHEVTHGYLHAANPKIPLWLDEGLAEYVEVPADQRGRHSEHEKTLLNLTPNPLQPMSDAEREREITVLSQMTEPSTMTSLDYARCWRMVRQLLQSDAGQQRLREQLRIEN